MIHSCPHEETKTELMGALLCALMSLLITAGSPHIRLGRPASHAVSKMPVQHRREREPAVRRGRKRPPVQRVAGHCDVLRRRVSVIIFLLCFSLFVSHGFSHLLYSFSGDN